MVDDPAGHPLATQIEDLKSAVRFLRVHACGLASLFGHAGP